MSNIEVFWNWASQKSNNGPHRFAEYKIWTLYSIIFLTAVYVISYVLFMIFN